MNYFKIIQGEWEAITKLVEDMSIVMKKSDNRSSMAVWNRDDFISKAEKQLGNRNIRTVQFK